MHNISLSNTSKFEKVGHWYILNHNCSNDLKLAIISKGEKYQLVLSHQNHRNAAEKVTRTLKNHLLSGLTFCDPNYPLHEWYRILLQYKITLN